MATKLKRLRTTRSTQGVIVQYEVGSPQYLAREERRAVLRCFLAQQHWSLEQQLSALSAIAFSGAHSGTQHERKLTIAWLEELLVDLKDTAHAN